MASTYSSSLRLELIGNGEQAGSWGSTTNLNLGTLLENAITGLVTVSVTSAKQALTANNGAVDQARMAAVKLTTTTTADFEVYIPPVAKSYIMYNTTAYDATIYNSTVLGNTTAAGAGVKVQAGQLVTIWSDGTVVRTVSNITTDANGNLGLGVTPSAWGSGYKTVDINTYGAITSNTGNSLFLTGNAFFNGNISA